MINFWARQNLVTKKVSKKYIRTWSRNTNLRRKQNTYSKHRAGMGSFWQIKNNLKGKVPTCLNTKFLSSTWFKFCNGIMNPGNHQNCQNAKPKNRKQRKNVSLYHNFTNLTLKATDGYYES